MSRQMIFGKLHDYRQVCHMLVTKGEEEAYRCFLEQAACLEEEAEQKQCLLRRTMLVSLNRGIYNFILFTRDQSLAHLCFSNMRHSGQCGTREAFEQAARKILRGYGEELQASRGDMGESLGAVCAYISDHLQEPLTLEEVAERTYMSRSQLCRLFRTQMGESFSAYVRNKRVERAKDLLAAGYGNMTQVAERCGFSSSAYFSTCFRQVVGCSPREFRCLEKKKEWAEGEDVHRKNTIYK